MKISVYAKPGSKKETVEKTDETTFIVRVKEKPEDGKANRAIIKILSEYFNVPSSRLKIIIGERSKRKIISIE